MSWLDNAIGWLSPERGYKRLRAGQAFNALRGYEAAKNSRRTEGWNTTTSSANAEIGPGLTTMRDRSRQQIRDNPYASHAIESLVANLVGTGIMPQCKAKKNKKRIEQLAKVWMKNCDAEDQMDFYGIQAVVVRAVKESGECIVRFRPRKQKDQSIVPLRLQVLEADFLDHQKVQSLDSGYIIQGVEFNNQGERVAYWLYDQHPGEVSTVYRNYTSQRVPAEEILHIYEKKRPGQVHGVPANASSINRMRELDEYQDAHLVLKKVEACNVGFITQPDAASMLTIGNTKADDKGNIIEYFEPGKVNYLRPGEDVRFNDPSSGAGLSDYVGEHNHAIAAGHHMTYEQMTGDLSSVNFSSIRAGTLEFRRVAEQFQWQCFVPFFLDPVWKKFIDMAVISGFLNTPDYDVEWSTPKWDYVNPQQEVNADISAVEAGFISRSEVIRRRGYDPEIVDAELAEDKARLDALGIVLGSPKDQVMQQPPDLNQSATE